MTQEQQPIEETRAGKKAIVDSIVIALYHMMTENNNATEAGKLSLEEGFRRNLLLGKINDLQLHTSGLSLNDVGIELITEPENPASPMSWVADRITEGRFTSQPGLPTYATSFGELLLKVETVASPDQSAQPQKKFTLVGKNRLPNAPTSPIKP